MSEWLPIESAPKDGMPLLAWDGEEAMVVANKWNARLGSFTGWYCVAYDMTWMNPTHWMPLPLPPA